MDVPLGSGVALVEVEVASVSTGDDARRRSRCRVAIVLPPSSFGAACIPPSPSLLLPVHAACFLQSAARCCRQLHTGIHRGAAGVVPDVIGDAPRATQC